MFLPLNAISRRLGIVALAAALLTHDPHVREEVHVDLDYTIALALFATSAFDVEAEASRVIAAHLGTGERGEELADGREDAGVGGGLLRGLRPMGSWSITTTLSIPNMPVTASCFPGSSLAP